MSIHDDIAAGLEALGNPTRLAIVRTLVRSGAPGLPVGTLRDRLDIAASTLSHHLSKLVSVGLVSQERRGTTLICRTEFDAVRGISTYLVEECCADECCGSERCGEADGERNMAETG